MRYSINLTVSPSSSSLLSIYVRNHLTSFFCCCFVWRCISFFCPMFYKYAVVNLAVTDVTLCFAIHVHVFLHALSCLLISLLFLICFIFYFFFYPFAFVFGVLLFFFLTFLGFTELRLCDCLSVTGRHICQSA